MIMSERGAGGGSVVTGLWFPSLQIEIKQNRFCTHTDTKLLRYLTHSQNQLMTTTLEFGKIKYKVFFVLDKITKKKKNKIRPCNLK
jgi:hypothetical protein